MKKYYNNYKWGKETHTYRERSEEKAENKKRPDVDKFHVTVLRRSFVCVKISYLGSLSFFLSLEALLFVSEESGPADRNLQIFFYLMTI